MNDPSPTYCLACSVALRVGEEFVCMRCFNKHFMLCPTCTMIETGKLRKKFSRHYPKGSARQCYWCGHDHDGMFMPPCPTCRNKRIIAKVKADRK